jgi:hypothetical protein
MKRGLLWTAVVCMLVLSGASRAQISGDHTLVGILEEVPGVYAGEKSHFGVRVAFEQNLSGWRAFPFECGNPGCLVSVTEKYPRETRWTVSSNGRILGTVLARTPADFAFYSHVGIQTVADGEKVPTVGNRLTDYSGFLESPVQRPLLTTASAPKLGPAHGGWKLGPLDPRDAKRVWPLFQRLVPLIDDCRLDARGEYIPSNGRAPKFVELEIASTWVNRADDKLLYARIRPEAFKECDGPMSYRSAYWYYRQSNGAVWLLPGQDTFAADTTGPFAELVMPLDFVDLLGDGNDEALFLMAGYDAGGYALFYDGFRKVTTFQWIYH